MNSDNPRKAPRFKNSLQPGEMIKQALMEYLETNLASCLANLAEKYPDLVFVVKCWPELPEHIKQKMKTLIKSTLLSREKYEP